MVNEAKHPVPTQKNPILESGRGCVPYFAVSHLTLITRRPTLNQLIEFIWHGVNMGGIVAPATVGEVKEHVEDREGGVKEVNDFL